MRIYNDIIANVTELLAKQKQEPLPFGAGTWPKTDRRAMILRSDMAYELGSDNLPGFSTTLITTDSTLVPEDKLVLIGDDLGNIQADRAYARIALIRADASQIHEDDKLYNDIKGIDYVKYHFHPEGFMLRISDSKMHESARVSKSALQNGLSFRDIGTLLIADYRKHAAVEAVALYFITDPAFPYAELQTQAVEASQITKTLDHIANSANMDCNTCNLQEICDEVEGLRQLHFSKQ